MAFFRRHGDEDHTGADMVMDPAMDMSHGGGEAAAAASDGHGSMMMSMTFQNNEETPLYSTMWTPNTTGAYVGTCIFLVVLAIIARMLLALKTRQEARWMEQEAQRRYVDSNGESGLPAGKMTATSDSGSVMMGQKTARRPWRITVDPLRAVLDTVIVGLGYMLMLAVMTMNIGYFFSVLGGVFVGSLAVGRYTSGEH